MRDWKCIPLFFTLERVVKGGTLDDLIVAHTYGGLSNQRIRKGLITFGPYGVFSFQITKFVVIMQLVNKHAPFMMGVYCMVHHTNLMSKLSLNLRW